MRVRAKEMAYWRGRRIRPGQVFDLPDGAPVHHWMQEVPASVPVGWAPKDMPREEPIAPSQMAHRVNNRPPGVRTSLPENRVQVEQEAAEAATEAQKPGRKPRKQQEAEA